MKNLCIYLFFSIFSMSHVYSAEWIVCYAKMEKNGQITDSDTYFTGATLLMCALTEVPKNYDGKNPLSITDLTQPLQLLKSQGISKVAFEDLTDTTVTKVVDLVAIFNIVDSSVEIFSQKGGIVFIHHDQNSPHEVDPKKVFDKK